MIHHLGTLAVAALVLTFPAAAGHDDERLPLAEHIRANYAKFEHRVPMRDGVTLFTAVYVPNDRSREHPIMLLRTPYDVGPYGPDRYRGRLGPSEDFPYEGYIFALQDVRGRYMSEGTYVNMRPHDPDKRDRSDIDESTDTYDTIEWLVRNVEGNNGRVGMWGISYPGFYASAGMIDSHPALRAVSPQACIADWWVGDDMHRLGAFNLNLTFNFFSRFGQPHDNPTTAGPDSFDHGTPDGYRFFMDLGPLRNADDRHFHGEVAFWNDIAAHPDYDDFWQSRNLLPHLNNVNAAVMVVGGWFDTEDLHGPLETYRSVERRNPGAYNVLLMGPWSHGGWARGRGRSLGGADFGFDTAEDYRRWILDFFGHFLKGEGDVDAFPEAMVFETGANRWRRFDAWPPAAARERSLYFRASGGLAFDAPDARGDAADAYPSDPRKPVPYTTEISSRWARDYMTEDQRFAARRPDVLVYRTGVLEDDLTVAGPIVADLRVSTTGTDSDFVVKLIDELPGENPGDPDDDTWPGHRQTLVRGGVIRGRYRDSLEHPRPFVPGEVTTVRFEIPDVLHTFKRGHRVMVQVQSSWFPFIDRNPQKYVDNIFEADEADFVTVTNRVHRTREHPSRIVIGVLE